MNLETQAFDFTLCLALVLCVNTYDSFGAGGVPWSSPMRIIGTRYLVRVLVCGCTSANFFEKFDDYEMTWNSTALAFAVVVYRIDDHSQWRSIDCRTQGIIQYEQTLFAGHNA